MRRPVRIRLSGPAGHGCHDQKPGDALNMHAPSVCHSLCSGRSIRILHRSRKSNCSLPSVFTFGISMEPTDKDSDVGGERGTRNSSAFFSTAISATFRFFYRLRGDSASSQDLVQEVFLRMSKYRHTFGAKPANSGMDVPHRANGSNRSFPHRAQGFNGFRGKPETVAMA